jgi:hypothetical protein
VWSWFVGQVTRLRRSIVGVFARGPQEPRRADEPFALTEPAARPPAHWVARVQRGAPGLLEPSLRRRREAAGPPMADGVARSQAELELQPEALDEPERDHAPQEPRVGQQRPEAPHRVPLWRKALRRERSPSAAPAAAVEASPTPTEDHLQRELQAAGSPHEELRDRRPLVGEAGPTPARPSPTAADEPERPPRPSDVVELEAPTLRRTAQVERAASPDRPTRADVASPLAANGRQAELAVDRIGTERVREPAVLPPAPRREPDAGPPREPAVPRPTSPQESSAEPGGRAEPLSAVDIHPWPELPPPLDHADGDVEAALRAWAHQHRIDHEQTRL